MKELNEYKAEIFSRMQKGINRRKKIRNGILLSVIPACVCAAAILAVGVWQGDFFEKVFTAVPDDSSTTQNGELDTEYIIESEVEYELDPQISPEISQGTTGSNGTTSANDNIIISPSGDNGTTGSNGVGGNAGYGGANVSNESYILNINQITSTSSVQKPSFDPTLYSTTALTDTEVADYLGIDMRNLGVGTGFRGIYVKNLVKDKSGNVVYDTFTTYYDDNITILTSKTGAPHDTVYTFETSEKSIFYTKTDKSGPQITALIGTDGSGFYFADFAVGGVNYRVIMKNCAVSKQIATVVKTIIDLSVK